MVTIDVTSTHVEEGKRYSCTYCPIAIALKPYIPSDRFDFSVGETVVRIVSKDYNTFRTILLPDEAIDFVINFDGGNKVSPFSFELPLQFPSSKDDGRQCDSEYDPYPDLEVPNDFDYLSYRQQSEIRPGTVYIV